MYDKVGWTWIVLRGEVGLAKSDSCGSVSMLLPYLRWISFSSYQWASHLVVLVWSVSNEGFPKNQGPGMKANVYSSAAARDLHVATGKVLCNICDGYHIPHYETISAPCPINIAREIYRVCKKSNIVGSRDIFFPGGDALRRGRPMCQPQFAEKFGSRESRYVPVNCQRKMSKVLESAQYIAEVTCVSAHRAAMRQPIQTFLPFRIATMSPFHLKTLIGQQRRQVI